MMTTLREEDVVFEFYINAFHLKDMVMLRMLCTFVAINCLPAWSVLVVASVTPLI